MGSTVDETTETTSESVTETTAETSAEPVTIVQVLPDSINQYIAEQSQYSAWVIVLLSVVIGVLLVEVFFNRWKF